MSTVETTDENKPVTYKECIDLFTLVTKPNETGEPIAKAKRQLLDQYCLPLLKFIIETTVTHKIPVNELPKIWTFCLIGHWTREFFNRVPTDMLTKLEHFGNPFDQFINDNVTDMVNQGPMIYNMAYTLENFRFRLTTSKHRFNTIFVAESSIEWYKANNCSYEFTESVEPIRPTLNMLERLRAAMSSAYDPVYQK